MGTRSITEVLDFDGNSIISMYIQYDGYQSGVGDDLRSFLSGNKLVNGYQSKDQKAFNGMGCLAASLVGHMKSGIGGVYLYPKENIVDFIDYNYTIYPSSGSRVDSEIKIRVQSGKEVLFDGLIDDYSAKDEWDDEQ